MDKYFDLGRAGIKWQNLKEDREIVVRSQQFPVCSLTIGLLDSKKLGR